MRDNAVAFSRTHSREFSGLQSLALMLLCLYLMIVSQIGCVVPPPLELEQADAPPNSPPVILGTTDDITLGFPGPIIIDSTIETPITLRVSDNDFQDTVYLNFYVDYGAPSPTPSIITCAGAPGAIERLVDCSSLGLLCLQISDNNFHTVELMASDRPLLFSGEPVFRAVPSDAQISFRSWQMQCI